MNICKFNSSFRCFTPSSCVHVTSMGSVRLCRHYQGGNFHSPRKVAFGYVSRFLLTYFASLWVVLRCFFGFC